MARKPDTLPETLPITNEQPIKRVRIVNLMAQKLIVNIMVNGREESVELGIKESSKPFPADTDFGPHLEVLRRAKRLLLQTA